MVNLSRELGRRSFFLDPTGELAPRFPLVALGNFEGAMDIANSVDALKRLIHSLNATLGIGHTRMEALVVPRDYASGLTGAGFALAVPLSAFELRPGTALGAVHHARPFLASRPRSLLLIASDSQGEVARLTVPALMFEILSRASAGFRPISQTERAYMVRLHGFYRALSASNWSEGTHVLFEGGRIIAKGKLSASGITLGAA
jgi:hypothetical protein